MSEGLAEMWRRTRLGWQWANLKIVDKSANLIRLRHNVAQMQFDRACDLQRVRGLPVRAIVLKARQEGISTQAGANVFEIVNRKPDTHAVIVSADADATAKIFRMYERFQLELPSRIKRPTERSNRKEIVYQSPHHSSILCQTAGKRVLGRGGTTQLVHASEVGFWAGAKTQLLGLLQEVPGDPETEVYLESTANGVGGEFHDRYWQAVERLKVNREDYSGYLPIFLPWYIFPEYRTPASADFVPDPEEQDTRAWLLSKGVSLTADQLQWRRAKIANECGGDICLFRQEYPSTAREAFQFTGRMVFSMVALDRLETYCRPPAKTVWFEDEGSSLVAANVLRRRDCWRIWRYPQTNHDYVVYGDVCEGRVADPTDPKSDPDYHFAGVLDRNTGELVATFHGQCDTIPYGEQMVRAARWYNMAWASPEINSVGLAVLNEFKRANYPNIYQRQGKEEEYAEQETSQLGVRLTSLNRKPGIERLKRVIVEGAITIYDQEVIDELRVFVNKDGKPQANIGYHDDSVMMLVGILMLHADCPMGASDLDQILVHRNSLAPDVVSVTMGGIDADEDDDDDVFDGDDVRGYL